MSWQKERAYRAGELKFHLYGAPGDDKKAPEHSEDWYAQRAQRIAKHHQH